MSSVHRRPRSPFWVCEYKSARGPWLKKSTKLRDKKKAEAWCTALQEAEDAIGMGSASEVQLREIISTTMAKVQGQKLAAYTTREWYQQWLDTKAGTIEKSTHKKYTQTATDFLTSLGAKADSRLETVVQSDIISFRQHQLTEGLTPSTINLAIDKIIAPPLRIAFTQRIIPTNPAADLPKLKDKGKKRKQAFSIAQVRAMLQAVPEENDWHGMILGGYSTGMRLGDMSDLDGSQVDFENKVIAFHQGKVQNEAEDDATVIALHPDFEAWIQKRKITPTSGPVFPTLAGRGSSGRSGLSGQFSKIMERAGIISESIREKTGKGRKVRALTYHSFRHSAASNVFKGKVIEQAQKAVTGHMRGKTLKTYTHVDIDAVKAAGSMIPRI